MIFALFIGYASAVVLVWCIFRYQEISDALIDSVPPEFKDGMIWRTAFPVFVLNPSTPLDLQAGYVQATAGFCLVILGFSLCCFLLEKAIVGWILLIMFFVVAAGAIKSWKTYKTNCSRRTVHHHEKET
jgi:hypothetical protein